MDKRLISLGLDYPRPRYDVYVKLWESKSSYIEVNDGEANHWLGIKGNETYQKFMTEYVEGKGEVKIYKSKE